MAVGVNATKLTRRQIKPADKIIDHADRIILAYPIFQAFRKQRALLAIHTLDEAPHPQIPPQITQNSYPANHIGQIVFTQPRPKAVMAPCVRESGLMEYLIGARRSFRLEGTSKNSDLGEFVRI